VQSPHSAREFRPPLSNVDEALMDRRGWHFRASEVRLVQTLVIPCSYKARRMSVPRFHSFSSEFQWGAFHFCCISCINAEFHDHDL
jgi:hypothetical protein